MNHYKFEIPFLSFATGFWKYSSHLCHQSQHRSGIFCQYLIFFFFFNSPRLVFRIQMNSLSHLLTYTYRLMATRFTAVGSSMSLRLWSSRTRSRVFCLSPTATRGGGLTPSIARLVFFHSLSPRRRPNPSSWISKTFQTWPMLTSTRRTPIYR